MIVLLLLLLVLVLLFVFQYVRLKRRYRFAKDIPSAEPCFPLIGNAWVYWFKNDEQLFVDMAKLLAHPARLFTLWAGMYPFICTNEPDMAYKILSHPNCLEKPFLYDFFKLQYAIFSGHYDVWRTQRKVLNMAFNLKILHSFIPIMEECGKRLTDRLSAIANGEPADISEYSTRCALEMVCATSIGIDVNQHHGAEKLCQITADIFNTVGQRVIRPLLYWDKLYNFTKLSKEEAKQRLEGYQYGDQILRDAINRKVNEPGDDDEFRKPKIFIDQLLDTDKFEEVEILQNVYTMIAAGTDTFGTTLNYILQMMALHPDLQECAYREVKQVFPTDDIISSPEALKQLEYLEMFIKETMRLFPIGPHMMREAYADLELDGIAIPKGTIFIVSTYNANRRKDVWGPNADCFDPENFSPERSKNRHPMSFLSFSAGPRNCIGHRYAMIAMKVVLVRILSKLRIRSQNSMKDIKFKFDALLRLSNEMYVTLENR